MTFSFHIAISSNVETLLCLPAITGDSHADRELGFEPATFRCDKRIQTSTTYPISNPDLFSNLQ